ncbi:MAG: hypothetical protein HKL95_10540 [Phycisphaerae bacterium]|nr:hypothetical protein [Phycisphaerae bacterium]
MDAAGGSLSAGAPAIADSFVPAAAASGAETGLAGVTDNVAADVSAAADNAVDNGIIQAGEQAGSEAVVDADAAEGGTSQFADHVWGKPDTMPCFPADALVHTPTGVKPIAELVLGDEVLSYDEKNRNVVTRRIRAVLKNWTDMLVKLKVGEEIIWATKIHPFYLPEDGKWVPSCDLRAGMRLLDRNLQPQTIDQVEHMAALEDTFNIEIGECHTYFVGEAGVLVHNESLFASTEKALTQVYGVIEDATKKVVYVGQTTRSIETRFAEEKWGDGYTAIELRQGTWTKYEAAVWEQHFIDANGGKGALQNINNAITEAKYARFKPLHSPC